MNQHEMSTFNQFAERHMALWNEPDAELRRQSIPELWAEDGVQFTRSREIRGYQALVERVGAAYEQFVKTEAFSSGWRATSMRTTMR
jgi:hypothetical protein